MIEQVVNRRNMGSSLALGPPRNLVLSSSNQESVTGKPSSSISSNTSSSTVCSSWGSVNCFSGTRKRLFACGSGFRLSSRACALCGGRSPFFYSRFLCLSFSGVGSFSPFTASVFGLSSFLLVNFLLLNWHIVLLLFYLCLDNNQY